MEPVCREFGHWRLCLMQGDITRVAADAIVNAANSALRGGGGVDGAIHRVGGPAVMEELNRVRPAGGCPAGGAVVTGAGNLPAKYVFHAVGPIWGGGGEGEAAALASCYRTCLRLAEERGVRTVSFPSISTGAYGYPLEEASQVALESVREHFQSGAATAVEEVRFVLFDAVTFRAYELRLRGM